MFEDKIITIIPENKLLLFILLFMVKGVPSYKNFMTLIVI